MRIRRRKNAGPKGPAKRAALAHAYGRAVRNDKVSAEPGGRLTRLQKAYIRRRIVDEHRRRKSNPRRKRSAAQRAAFGRMRAGLARYRARGRRRNPVSAVIAGLNSANPSRKVTSMPRRRSAAQRAAFKKMIAGLKRSKGRRRNPSKIRHRKKRRSSMARRKTGRRRSRVVVMTNPRRRRRSNGRRLRRRNPRRRMMMRHRRRRNPGRFTDTIKMFFGAGIPGLVGTGLAGFLDAKFLSGQSTLIRVGARLAEALVAAFTLRSKPMAAYAAIGGLIGSVGWEQGYAMGGGVTVGATPVAKAAGVAALVREDPRAMGVLVKAMKGMGLTLDNNVSLGAGSALDSGLPANAYTDVNLG